MYGRHYVHDRVRKRLAVVRPLPIFLVHIVKLSSDALQSGNVQDWSNPRQQLTLRDVRHPEVECHSQVEAAIAALGDRASTLEIAVAGIDNTRAEVPDC